MSPINQKIQRFLQSTWPPKAASALLLILSSWWAFANILLFFEEKEITPAPQVVKTTKTPEHFSLKNLDLFGEPEKNKAVNKTSEAKQTKLNLTLRGVLATDDPKQGIAQIQNARKLERHFSVSDSIFGQATLEEIYSDRVIILHNGNYETLKLPAEFLSNKHFLATQLKQEQKKIVTDFRKLLVNRKGMDLIKLFGFDTVYKNGGFYGFSIKVLGEAGQKMIDTLGVEEGDIIVAANGQRFAESIEAVNSLTKLKTATKINVEIDREGSILFFDLEFDETVTADAASDNPAAQQKNTNKQKSDNSK